jgi:stringent starvation protein B
MTETSTKPYMLRALHEWCTDNGYTPHLVVHVDTHTRVPAAFVQDGQITLNVSSLATQNLVIGPEFIEFQARFGGKTEQIFVPVAAVSAIYARETGAGMGFEIEPNRPPAAVPAAGLQSERAQGAAEPDGQKEEAKPKRPALKIVK